MKKMEFKNVEMFGRKIPGSLLIATILLAAIGAGVMESQFAKGPQTFYAFEEASVVQNPNRIDNIARIEVNALKGEKASEDFQDVFRLFHRNGRLVKVDVRLMNPETIKKSFNDFTILIRKENISNPNNETIVAVLHTSVDAIDIPNVNGVFTIGPDQLVGKAAQLNADILDQDEDDSDDNEDDIVDSFVDQDDCENGCVFEAKIFFSAKENAFANEIPIVIGAEVTSQ